MSRHRLSQRWPLPFWLGARPLNLGGGLEAGCDLQPFGFARRASEGAGTARARIIGLRGTIAASTIVRRRTSWNPLHSWIALAGVGRLRPYPATTAADRLATKGSAIHRTRRRSRRSSPSCAPLVMTPTESGSAVSDCRAVACWAADQRSARVGRERSGPGQGRDSGSAREGRPRREVGMDRWAWEQLDPWLNLRAGLPSSRTEPNQPRRRAVRRGPWPALSRRD